jgi:hypothetical protein
MPDDAGAKQLDVAVQQTAVVHVFEPVNDPGRQSHRKATWNTLRNQKVDGCSMNQRIQSYSSLLFLSILQFGNQAYQ